MKDEHIINLLEENKFKDLSDAEIRLIENHAAGCAECRREYEAARVAALVVEERAAQTLEPTPFFEARVMNAWRERQAAMQPIANRIRQLWRDTKILVSGLATGVALLLILAVFAPLVTSDNGLQTAAIDDYSVESVIFERQESSEDLTDAQLLQEIYEDDDLEN